MRAHRQLLAVAVVVPLIGAATLPAGAAGPAVIGARQPVGSVVLVSHALDGQHSNGISARTAVSADGRYIAYISGASNLVGSGAIHRRDNAYVWDATTDTNALVTKGYDGSPANGNTSFRPSISGNGRYVVYESTASNLVPGDTNSDDDIFLTDMQTGTTRLVSGSATGGPANDSSFFPAVSPDGKFVTYASDATNLVASDPNGHLSDIFLFNVATGKTTLITHSTTGGGTDGNSLASAISGNDGVIVFESLATNLVADDANGVDDIFAYDVASHTTSLISVAADGDGANAQSEEPTVSADGNLVSFTSAASNLVAQDANGALDIFVRDRSAGVTTVLTTTPSGRTANASSFDGAISSDGSTVTFLSQATNLPIAGRHHVIEVYEIKLTTQELSLISVGMDGKPGNRDAESTAITADGSYVAFASAARNLATVDFRKGNDVFRYRNS